MEAKQATLHHELIAQLLDSRSPKTEREHAAAREIERLRADLLQELVDAPEAEPVAYATGYYAGCLSIATVDGRVLPAGTALYAAPPEPSVPDGWKHDCAGILQNDVELWVDSCPHCGKPRPAAPTPAEAPADVARDAEKWRMLPAFLEEFQIPYLQLEGKIDAAIRARGEKGQS